MAASPTRQSDRLRAQREEEERLAREAALVAQGLPTDGSLEFRDREGSSWSTAYKIRYKDVHRTADGAYLYSWAVEAFWDSRTFYPGQIIMATSPHSQNDPTAKFSEVAGAGPCAATSAGPVGKIHVPFLMLLCF